MIAVGAAPRPVPTVLQPQLVSPAVHIVQPDLPSSSRNVFTLYLAARFSQVKLKERMIVVCSGNHTISNAV